MHNIFFVDEFLPKGLDLEHVVVALARIKTQLGQYLKQNACHHSLLGFKFNVPETNLEDLRVFFEKEGKIGLISLNPLYKPYELAVVEIREIWRFIHYISEELPSGEVSPADLAYTLNQLKQDIALIKDRIVTNEN